jgi:hypothetical protein
MRYTYHLRSKLSSKVRTPVTVTSDSDSGREAMQYFCETVAQIFAGLPIIFLVFSFLIRSNLVRADIHLFKIKKLIQQKCRWEN